MEVHYPASVGYDRPMFFLLSAALATVTIDDLTGCVDPERLENELSLLLGDRFNDLRVHVVVEGDGEVRRTQTEVRTRGSLVWSRRLEVTSDDCDALPEALALTLQGGLSALPGWSWEERREERPLRWSAGIGSSLGGSGAVQLGLEVGPDVRITRGLGWWIHGRAFTGLPVVVGSGSATLLGGTLATGPQLSTERIRVWLGIEGGQVWAFGQGFGDNLITRLPRLGGEIGGSIRFGASSYLAVHTLLPITKLVLLGPDGDYREGPFAIGLTIGLRSGGPKKLDLSEVEVIGRASGGR